MARELGTMITRRALVLFVLSCMSLQVRDLAGADVRATLDEIGFERGICAVLGLPAEGAELVADLARQSELVIYFQATEPDAVRAVRQAAESAGLLGERIFVGEGDLKTVHLADNIAGAALLSPSARVDRREVLRVLHPGGKVIGGDEKIVKPRPEGVDSWDHPFHRPDNNPQSTDRLARAPYLTQFLAEPKFCPMPQISVAAGGKVFRAFGHIAHKANQNAMLNTLIGVNAYNGTILWKRKLSEGFMIHRNTLVATDEYLYLADHESCKLIDSDTGKIVAQIVIPEGAADGSVWKWMGMDTEKGVLYALVGGKEIEISTKPSKKPGMGHWPWGMWEGHGYKNAKTNFGFGRNFVAIDLKTRKILWNHRQEEYIDSRGVCMKGSRIYFYSPGKHLSCLDVEKAEVVWKSDSPDLLKAIGSNGRAQHYMTGYATTSYIKCTDDEILFAGPQRSRLVSASAKTGYLLWQRDGGNLQLVLRDDGIYAAGPKNSGVRLAYTTGDVLSNLATRRACTRATGSIDSVFYRTTGGTVRLDVPTNSATHIAPMRPPCQDGVIISDGYLYWGPWMCGCQLSLYGHISLGPSGDFDRRGPAPAERLEIAGDASPTPVDTLLSPDDWLSYRGDNQRSASTSVPIPSQVERRWQFSRQAPGMPTAPVAMGDSVFFGDRSGIVWCLGDDGKPRWKAYTGASIYFPPAVDAGRVFAGSADGWVYAFDAASGRRLWRFRLAPAERRIPVYGELISTWPVSGGVVVEKNTVYAAAGIAHYDGTHVVALDKRTGTVKWYNNTSGELSESAQSGVSLQGSLSIQGNELRFAGGGLYRVARYDLETGRCLNDPRHSVTSQFATAFYPFFPEYGQFLSCRREFDDGRTLLYNAKYDASQHSDLVVLAPASPTDKPEKVERDRPRTDRPRSDRPRRDGNTEKRRRKMVWGIKGQRYNSLVTAPNAVLAAAQHGDRAVLAALDLATGKPIWEVELPAPAVKGGTAVDRRGRIIVSLENGQVECYAAP